MRRITPQKTIISALNILVSVVLSHNTFATVPIVKDGEPVAAIVLSIKTEPGGI